MTLPVILLGIWNKWKKKIGYSEHWETRFKGRWSPTIVLKEKLDVVGLQSDVFKGEPILFNKLKKRLSRKFQIAKFQKYCKFIETMNKDYFQWQLGIIWEVLFNKKRMLYFARNCVVERSSY